MRSSRESNLSCETLTSERMELSLGEALSSTSARSEMQREMASMIPGGGGKWAAISARLGARSLNFSKCRARSREAMRVPLTESNSDSMSTPPRLARLASGRMSNEPPTLKSALRLSSRRASVVSACRSRASLSVGAGFRSRARSAEALKEA